MSDSERNTLVPPSHVTKSQAARIVGCVPSKITKLIDTGVLEPETWFGTPMIPLAALSAVTLSKPGRRPHTSKEPTE